MDKQIDCVHCVASGTQAWTDFARLQYGWNSRFTQDDIWSYAASQHGSWGGAVNSDFITRQYNQGSPVSCTTYSGNRRAVNVSLDDGIDPYGEAWIMYSDTPPAYYYHQYVFDTGPMMNGREFASHSMAWALRYYGEPVGVNIGNGGHFVLVTYVNTVADPIAAGQYYTPINSVAYRDPLRDYGYQRVQLLWTDWWNTLTPYGFDGESYHSAYNCHDFGNDPTLQNANCQDETHYGPQAGNLWWGRWVIIERDTDSSTPDSVHGIFSR
jgi:hypothetical protein